MKLIVKSYDLDSSEPSVIIHDDDCVQLGVKVHDRVKINSGDIWVSLVGNSDTIVDRGQILIPNIYLKRYDLKDGDEVDVSHSPKPDSVVYIRKKMDNKVLTKEEIYAVVNDILEAKLSNIEISAWLTALYINGMDLDEISHFTNAMVDTGDRVEFTRSPVFDFHSVGGVPGNKVTPIVVSIVAAAGLMLPKTSSRAISSACGTSDFVETFCDVELSVDRVRSISEEVGAVLAWGGSMNLAPVDDMVIRIENPLGINPRAQMLASILSKKVAIGATHLLMDIPMGAGTKIPTMDVARAYVRDFTDLGHKLGMHVECAITYADQPVGYAIGPNLEARECIRVLEGDSHPGSVIEKSCALAGMILEMGGIPNGTEKARALLSSGAAMKKFREIVAAQGGNYDIKSSDLVPGEFSQDVLATKAGFVHSIDNKAIVQVAKAAGSPSDKGAGLIILKKRGQRVEKGDVILRIHADNEAKCIRAKELALRYSPIHIEGMLIEKG